MGTDTSLLHEAKSLDADFISVNYSPGKSARVNSAFAAAWIKQNTGKEVIFSLSTRDMNRVAAQGLLLGAGMMGLENVVVVKGDSFTESELEITKPVDDYAPTGLIRAVADMNRGIDYKGLRLQNPTGFCIGATIDLTRSMDRQVALTRKKVEAGSAILPPPAPLLPGTTDGVSGAVRGPARRGAVGAHLLRGAGIGERRSSVRRPAGLGDVGTSQRAFGRRHRGRDGEQVSRHRAEVDLSAGADLPGRAARLRSVSTGDRAGVEAVGPLFDSPLRSV